MFCKKLKEWPMVDSIQSWAFTLVNNNGKIFKVKYL